MNGGDVPCGIVATISASGGSVVTPMISCGGKYVKCPVTLSDGDTLVIDTRERQKKITLNGSAYYLSLIHIFWDGMAVALVYSVLMGVVMYFLGEYVSLIFIDKDEARLVELLSYVREFLRKNCILYIPLGILTVCRFSLQGLEHGFTAMFAGVFEMVARSVMALWAVKFFGFDAVCYANPAAWIAACIPVSYTHLVRE